MNSIITRVYYVLVWLFLLDPETSAVLNTASAVRIPFAAPAAITKCSTVAFWSRSISNSNNNSNSNSNQNKNSDPKTASMSTTSLLAATRNISNNRISNKNRVITFKNMEEVLERFHEEPIGVFFGTKSCGPCHSMKEEMNKVHSAFGNELRLFNVDIDRWPSVASKMNVIMAPTLLVLQQGQVQLRLEGMVPAETILKELHSFLGHDQI